MHHLPNLATVSETTAGSAAPPGRLADPGKEWRREHGIPVVPVFDGFRALAIMAIVFFHVFGVSGAYGALGGSFAGALAWALPIGLTGLFIISGFVVFLPTVASGGEFGSVGRYAIRRAARIVPAYWFVLLLVIVLLAVIGGSGGVPGFGPIGAHFTLLETPALLFDTNFPLGLHVVPAVWTLSIEFAFYAVLPLIATAYFRRPFVGLAIGLATTIVWYFAATNANDIAGLFGAQLSDAAQSRIALHYGSQFPAWAFAFACGMTAAWAYVRLRVGSTPSERARRAALGVAGSALAFCAFLYLTGHRAQTDPDAFVTMSLPLAIGTAASLAALFLSLSLAPRPAQLPFANRPIRRLADISYGVYLIHLAIIWLAVRELDLSSDGGVGALVAWIALVVPLSILYGYLSARFLERPIRRWAHRFGRRGAAAEGARDAGVGGVAQPTSVPSTRNATRT